MLSLAFILLFLSFSLSLTYNWPQWSFRWLFAHTCYLSPLLCLSAPHFFLRESRKLELRKAEGGLVPEDAMISWVLNSKFWSCRAVFPGGLEITAGVKLDINALWFKSFCVHKPGVTLATWHNGVHAETSKCSLSGEGIEAFQIIPLKNSSSWCLFDFVIHIPSIQAKWLC